MTAGRQIDRIGIAAAMTTVVLWSSGYVGIRAVATELSPGSIAIGRLLVASVILAVLVLRRRTWVPMARRDLALVVGSGIFWYALYFVTLNQAEQTVDAGTASMLVNTGPIFVALLAGLLLGEGFPRRLLIGSAIAFAGSVIIGFASRSEAPTSAGDPTLGIVLCIVAAAAYATGVTLQKPALRRVPALQLTFVAVLTATIVTLPFTPDLLTELTSTKLENTLWITYLGVFPTAIAFTTWSIALSRMPAGRLAALTYLVPPIVVVMGWAILGEVPPALAIAGGALCVGGVIVARSSGGFRLPTRAQATPKEPAEPTSS